MTVVPASGDELQADLTRRYERIESLVEKFNLTTQ